MFLQDHCQRCKKPTIIQTMSIFNREMLCKACKEEEKTFPEYKEACRIELEEVRKGNLNFEGIGLPPYIKVARLNKNIINQKNLNNL